MDRNTPYSNRHRLRLIRDQLTTWGTTNNKVQVANNAELIPECERPLMQHLAQRNPFPNLQDPNDEESELNSTDDLQSLQSDFEPQETDESEVNDGTSNPFSNHPEKATSDGEPFRTRIADWIVRRRLNLADADELLSIFRSQPWGRELPKSARTLIQTPRIVNIKRTTNGEYHHIGLEYSIRKVFQQVPLNDR